MSAGGLMYTIRLTDNCATLHWSLKLTDYSTHASRLFRTSCAITSRVQRHNKVYVKSLQSYLRNYLNNWIRFHRSHDYTRTHNCLACSYSSHVGYKWQDRSSRTRQHLSTTRVHYSRGIVHCDTSRHHYIQLFDANASVHHVFRFSWTLLKA